ncbi:hypothetical protein [Blastococcus sp. SYSU DS0619]
MTRSAPIEDVDGPRQSPTAGARPTPTHVHWFRYRGDDPFSGSSLYACRCGQVRASI